MQMATGEKQLAEKAKEPEDAAQPTSQRKKRKKTKKEVTDEDPEDAPPRKSAKHFLTPCPQSHIDCLANSAPAALNETATVQTLCSCQVPVTPLPRQTHQGSATSRVALICDSLAAAKVVLDSGVEVDTVALGSTTTSSGGNIVARRSVVRVPR